MFFRIVNKKEMNEPNYAYVKSIITDSYGGKYLLYLLESIILQCGNFAQHKLIYIRAFKVLCAE